ncbi:MAG: hypothetical protein ABFD92_12595 [Planctomycetaceae bacterium]|nr:hypothetical protein [Planctomycetaceae bacterium]
MWRMSVIAVLAAGPLAAWGQATSRPVDAKRQAALNAELSTLTRKLIDNPTDVKVRTELIRFCLVRMNAPEKANTLLHVSVDATLRRLVPLACKNLEELDAASCFDLGKWYLCDLAPAAEAGIERGEMLTRARAFLERFLNVRARKDAARIEAMVLLDDVKKALAGGPLPPPESKDPPKPEPEPAAPADAPAGPSVIEVHAQTMWNAAGKFKKGQSLEFRAGGIWSMQSQRGSCTPDGRDFGSGGGKIQGYLRGRIAGGEPFKIGSQFIMAMPADGLLELGMEESSDPQSYLDNSGSIKVTITVR